MPSSSQPLSPHSGLRTLVYLLASQVAIVSRLDGPVLPRSLSSVSMRRSQLTTTIVCCSARADTKKATIDKRTSLIRDSVSLGFLQFIIDLLL